MYVKGLTVFQYDKYMYSWNRKHRIISMQK